MIKINLLPVKRVAAKKAKVPVDEAVFQLVVGLGILLVFVGACGYRWLMLVDEVALQTQLKESKTKELESLKKKVQEVEDYEKNKQLRSEERRVGKECGE